MRLDPGRTGADSLYFRSVAGRPDREKPSIIDAAVTTADGGIDIQHETVGHAH
jgi:hypothetical protein